MHIQYQLADKSMASQIAQFQAEVFTKREPMTMCLGFTYDEYISYMTKLYEATLDDTVSFVAMDVHANRLVGIFVGVDCCYSGLDLAFTERELQAQALSNSFFALFDDALAPYKIEKPKDACLLSYAAVDSEYLRRGIMSGLLERAYSVLKQEGYQYAITYTTNDKSANSFQKDKAFVKLKTVNYAQCGIAAFSNAPGECTLFLGKAADLNDKHTALQGDNK